jgi:hypothetical protein
LKVHKNQLFVAEADVGNQDPKTSYLCLLSHLSSNPYGLCFGKMGQVSVLFLDGSNAGAPPLKGLASGRPCLEEVTL